MFLRHLQENNQIHAGKYLTLNSPTLEYLSIKNV